MTYDDESIVIAEFNDAPGVSGRRSDGSPLRRLLKCPNCRADGALEVNSNPVICAKCSAVFSATGGILDFVAGRDNTILDVIAYDLEKDVSRDRSLALFGHIKRGCGELLSENLGNILEIGAGTGLLTIGMLELNPFEAAVISDISPEMLSICRGRVERNLDADKFSRTLFLTYSGKEDVFATGAYDLCIANSVVHHILDYRGFFADVRRALKPTGIALFVEPSGPFHDAMTLAVNDVLIAMVGEGAGSDHADVKALASWTAQTRSGLIFPEADKSAKEDKHLFSRADLEVAARAAGFADLSILPWHFDPIGLSTMDSYLRGIGVSSEFREMFLPKYAAVAEHHFQDLAEQDKTSMYLVGLHAAGTQPLH